MGGGYETQSLPPRPAYVNAFEKENDKNKEWGKKMRRKKWKEKGQRQKRT